MGDRRAGRPSSGITAALAETGRDLADARSAPCELGGRLERERDELRFVRGARVHPDLAVGQVGELGGHPVVFLLPPSPPR